MTLKQLVKSPPRNKPLETLYSAITFHAIAGRFPAVVEAIIRSYGIDFREPRTAAIAEPEKSPPTANVRGSIPGFAEGRSWIGDNNYRVTVSLLALNDRGSLGIRSWLRPYVRICSIKCEPTLYRRCPQAFASFACRPSGASVSLRGAGIKRASVIILSQRRGPPYDHGVTDLRAGARPSAAVPSNIISPRGGAVRRKCKRADQVTAGREKIRRAEASRGARVYGWPGKKRLS